MEQKSTLTLLDLIAYAELFNGRYKDPPITDILYDLKRGMVTMDFYDNEFSITFHRYEIRNYTTEYLESILKEIMDKIARGEIRKESYYDGTD